MIKFAYHLYECIVATLFHRERRDFSEHFFHHIVTIVLVSYSYFTNVMPIGMIVMLVTDSSDIFVSIFKLTVDVSKRFQIYGFIGMFVAWLYMRIWFYPVYLIYEIWVQSVATGHVV